MPSIRNNEFKNFFKQKTIQRTDKFLVTFIEPTIYRPSLSKESGTDARLIGKFNELQRFSGPMPKIEHWHITNVTIPFHNFNKEVIRNDALPKSFPVLNHDGFEITFTIEEDEFGTISDFIIWNQKRIIDSRGIYWNNSINRIPSIIIEVLNPQNNTSRAFRFNDCYYLNSTPITYDYTSSTALAYSLTFGTDTVDYMTNSQSTNPFGSLF